MRLAPVLAASVTLAAPTPVAFGVPVGDRAGSHDQRRRCPRLFTVRMGQRAARAIYRGSHHASLRNLRLLGRIEMCERVPVAQSFVRWYDRHQRALQIERETPSLSAMASWYDDAGQTASGFHSYYGVATCGDQTGVCFPFGTRIRFAFGGRTIVAVVDDHGPYANGASFDLNKHVAEALGFSGVQTVGYQIGATRS